MVKYQKFGPNSPKYGLSATKNKSIASERSRRDMYSDSSAKRNRLSSTVAREGGKVYWDKDASKEDVLPYTGVDSKKLYHRAEKVAAEMQELEEKYGMRDLHGNVADATALIGYLEGNGSFNMAYSPEGRLQVTNVDYSKKEKGGRIYSLIEANGVLRNLERYANQIKRIESFKQRHGNKSKLEASASAVIAILGLGFGTFLLSSNVTGNVIRENIISSGNIFGGILFIAGIIGSFFYFRKK